MSLSMEIWLRYLRDISCRLSADSYKHPHPHILFYLLCLCPCLDVALFLPYLFDLFFIFIFILIILVSRINTRMLFCLFFRICPVIMWMKNVNNCQITKFQPQGVAQHLFDFSAQFQPGVAYKCSTSKIGVFNNFAIVTGKHVRGSIFLINLQT